MPPQFAPHDDFGGLRRDATRLIDRRHALTLLGGIGLTGLVAACDSGTASTPSASTGATPTTASASATSTSPTSGGTNAGSEIPDETQGPFPADGSNGPNVLVDDAVVRSDLTTSFGDASGTAEGVPMTLELTVVEATTGAPRAGAAVYLWHCTADGRYSIYEISDQNYLRGMQTTDDAGRLAFTTVFPGCYPGRWPHFHFEVYASLNDAQGGTTPTKTSQIALPEADCVEVYGDDRYGSSAGNLARLSLDTDGVFADGWVEQLATVSGSASEGSTASLLVRV